ncbi:protein kinase, partial [Planctomycetota bacterium]
MNNETDIKMIVAEALEKPTPEAQQAYLAEACGDDTGLRQEVESLLELEDQVGDFLESPLLDPDGATIVSPLAEGPGTIIGPYKLLEQIGEGGMAVVYMAEQKHPIRRKVALKIIKPGMDTKQVIARFEAERQALALMNHPHIAKVFDAGTTETGHPYFVMELVRGVSITEYCDQQTLSTHARLELFIQVCNAVQHAHHKGVIHRDLKPSNIMVTLHDGQHIAVVIDFGIAKATSQQLTEKTLFTRYAQMIGTPEYMSPEQAEMSRLDVDTRTDIYSLGVLLYELLTGTTPVDSDTLREAGYAEIQRIIRESQPPKPSTRISSLGDTLSEIALRRHTTPDILRKSVKGDLDWIVMKSLDKDRTRRYETPGSLAQDVQRHLDHEPVSARSPGMGYRLQKFFRRYRLRIVAVVMSTVLFGTVLLTLLAWNRNRLQLADVEEAADRGNLVRARASFTGYDFESARKEIQSIITSPHVGPEAQLLEAGILVETEEPNKAIVRLKSLLDEQPEIAGAAHALLARIYWENVQGSPARLALANEHRQKAEALLPDTAEAYYLRALTAVTIKESPGYLNQALNIAPDHYPARTMRTRVYLCSQKFSLAAEDALCLIVQHPQDPAGYRLRADSLAGLGRLAEAVDAYSRAIDRTANQPDQLIDLYQAQGIFSGQG